jgi:hypothetical protein
MRQEVDADAQRPHLAHTFEDVDARSDLVQAERGYQAADACADHEYPMLV